MKKKIAGKERPFAHREFFSLVWNLAKEQEVEGMNILDYDLSCGSDTEIVDSDISVESRTVFGSCEGIYTDWFFRNCNGEEIRFGCAKTLSKTDDDFITMNILGAKVCLIARKYLFEHEDEFNWRGFNVRFTKDGKNAGGYWCGKLENAISHAKEGLRDGFCATIRDNSTRKNVKF